MKRKIIKHHRENYERKLNKVKSFDKRAEDVKNILSSMLRDIKRRDSSNEVFLYTRLFYKKGWCWYKCRPSYSTTWSRAQKVVRSSKPKQFINLAGKLYETEIN